VSKTEVFRTCCFLEPVKPFRKSSTYTNWNYELATEVIERVTGTTYRTFVREKFFNPLGLKRTTYDIPTGENVAPAYAVSNSGTPYRTVFPVYSDHTGLAGVAAGKSTVEDLLPYINRCFLPTATRSEPAQRQHPARLSNSWVQSSRLIL
jgi:CubicO group peptidase (beta-lactamase class C family)